MNEHNNPVKCIKCTTQATWLVNETPYCAYHVEARVQWLLYHEGAVSRFYNEPGFVRGFIVSRSYNELGFVYSPDGDYIPVKE